MPLSPVIRTVASDFATRLISRRISAIGGALSVQTVLRLGSLGVRREGGSADLLELGRVVGGNLEGPELGDVLQDVEGADRIAVGVAQRLRRAADVHVAVVALAGEFDRFQGSGRLQEAPPRRRRQLQGGKQGADVGADQLAGGPTAQRSGGVVGGDHAPLRIGRDQSAADGTRQGFLQHRQLVALRFLFLEQPLGFVEAAGEEAGDQGDEQERRCWW